MALDATPGGVNADSYVTVAEADAYFGNRLHASAWTALGTSDKEKALKMATVRLDEEHWDGARAEDISLQALRWPRYGAVDIDGHGIEGDEIPRQLKEATYELALAMVATDLLKASGLEGFESIKVGPISVDVRQIPEGNLPDVVVRRLRGLRVAGSSGFGQPRLVRG